jgi:DNA-binding NtrC family response regulator
LSTIPVLIPPLRERPEDIPVLALRFAMRVAAEMGKKIEGLSPDAVDTLMGYPWPGNVRELQHVIERAVILTPDPLIQPHCLEGTRFGLAHSLGGSALRPRAIGVPGATATPRSGVPLAVTGAAAAPGALNTTRFGAGVASTSTSQSDAGAIALSSLNVAEAERVLIQHALAAANDNRTKAAELLGISVRTLRNKLNGPGKELDEGD